MQLVYHPGTKGPFGRMKGKHKRILIGIGSLGIVLIMTALWYAWLVAEICVAYKAKRVCSDIFVSGQDAQSVLDTDVFVDDLAKLRYIRTRVDLKERTVTAQFLGLITRKAIHRPELGCTLALGPLKKAIINHQSEAVISTTQKAKRQPWPAGDLSDKRLLPGEINQVRLESALDWAFSESDPAHMRRTRAVVIVYSGRIVAERYAPGFTKDTPLIGWSMTKSTINALIGILVKEEKLSIESPAPIP